MKSISTACVLLLCIALSSVASAQKKDAMTKKVKVHSNFTIPLTANQSTGYSWVLADSLNGKLLKKVSDVYQQGKAKPHMTGVPGQQVFTFKALHKGTAKINLAYVQPWVKEIPADAQKQQYTVVIR